MRIAYFDRATVGIVVAGSALFLMYPPRVDRPLPIASMSGLNGIPADGRSLIRTVHHGTTATKPSLTLSQFDVPASPAVQ